jgi:nicotinamide riboside kinase
MGKIMKGYKYKGKWKEKEVEDPTCLYEHEVEHLIGKKYWIEFAKWMRGQGCPVMSDKTIGFFKWDVEQFIEEELTWHTLDGRAIQIKDLEDEHLLNIKTHLEERIRTLNQKSSKEWLKKIKKEIKKRKL